MIQQHNNIPIIHALRTEEVLTEGRLYDSQRKNSLPTNELSTCLYDTRGIYVKVNKVAKTWLSKESTVLLSNDKRLVFKLKVTRFKHCFGNIPLVDEVLLFVKAEKIDEKKPIIGWQDSQKETKANRGAHEERINRELRDFIQDIAIRNCEILTKIKPPVDKMRFECDVHGQIQEKGKYAFYIEHHLFKPLGMSDSLSLYGWNSEDNDNKTSTFIRLAVISATLTEFGKNRHLQIFSKEHDEQDFVGKSDQLAADTHPTRLYGISPRRA